MSGSFSIADLRRILRASAGAEQGVDLDGDILDTPFTDLGYDSLAVLETAAHASQEAGVRLDEEEVGQAVTPRLLLELINRTQRQQ